MWYGARYSAAFWNARSPYLGFRMGLVYLALPVGAGLLLMAILPGLRALAPGCRTRSDASTMLVTVVVLSLCVLLAMRVPIAFALGISAWLYMWLSDVSLLVLAQQVANGPDNWILLAMPLFVLAGLLMNATGIADRIFALARALRRPHPWRSGSGQCR